MLNTLFGETLYRRLKPLAKIICYHKYNVAEGDYTLPQEEAYVLVGQHISGIDSMIINCFSNRLIRFLYEDYTPMPTLQRLFLERFEMIPFQKHMTEYEAVQRIQKHLLANHPVGIFPEVGPTWENHEQVTIPAMAKLIKQMGVGVYGVHLYGSYLSKPEWARHSRRGQIKIETFLVLSAQDVQTLSIQQIKKHLSAAIEYDDYIWQSEADVMFKGKRRAENIERLLYVCPECNAFNTFTSHKHEFICNSCDTRFSYSMYGTIEQKNQPYKMQINTWTKWQATRLDKIDYFPECRQMESYIDESPYIGPIVISKEGIHVQTFIPYKEMQYLRSIGAFAIVFYYKDKKYRLVFKEGATVSVKFIYDYIRLHQNCI